MTCVFVSTAFRETKRCSWVEFSYFIKAMFAITDLQTLFLGRDRRFGCVGLVDGYIVQGTSVTKDVKSTDSSMLTVIFS